MPFELLKNWINEEKILGAPNPQQAVLTTTTKEGMPHARVIAIREIDSQKFLFFTQKGTRKVKETQLNPHVALAFWFELKQRQVIIDGMIEMLPDTDNLHYWQIYPREAQIRFSAYAPSSGKEISSKQDLEDKRSQIAKVYENNELPMSPYYCGFWITPSKFSFYEYRSTELSDVFEYNYKDNFWSKKLMSP